MGCVLNEVKDVRQHLSILYNINDNTKEREDVWRRPTINSYVNLPWVRLLSNVIRLATWPSDAA
jgi:hypothetical protein